MPEYNKRSFVINMLTMSLTMLAVRIGGLCFNIYFTSVIGAQSTGLFHLIFSVYGFMLTFSVSGTGIAVTRLVSESSANDERAAVSIVRRCSAVCLCTSLAAAIAVCAAGDWLSGIIGDKNAAPALVLLAVSLPPAAVSGVLRGYFMAVRRVGCVTLSQLAEEISSAVITIIVLARVRGSETAYMSVVFGISVSAFIGLTVDFVMYRNCTKQRFCGADIAVPYRNIFAISMPVALGSYLRSALVAAENVLIPGRLSLSGTKNALAQYGVIKGMSMPLIMFPSVFISAFASMLVTELASRNACGKRNGIKYISQKSCEYTLHFGCMTAAVLMAWGADIAGLFYPQTEVGRYLTALSLLVVPMYLDSVVDSMLKGLNEQMSSLRFNIIDSALRIFLIWFVIPRFGVAAYIGILYASEIFNLHLSISRLAAVSHMKLGIAAMGVPCLCAVLALGAARLANGGITDVFVFVFVYCSVAAVIECLRRRNEKIHGERQRKKMRSVH